MSTRSWFARHNKPLLLILLLLLAGAAWLGWSYCEKRYPSWYEEVRLSDGRVITIHQKRQYFESYGTNQSWVTIDLPELGGRQVWHSHLMPQRVDVVSGKVYVFGIPRGDVQYSYYNDPKHFIVAFEWSGADFLRIPFLGVPKAIAQEENVFRCVPFGVRRLGLEQKDAKWCESLGSKLQSAKAIDLLELQEASRNFARRGGRIPTSE